MSDIRLGEDVVERADSTPDGGRGSGLRSKALRLAFAMLCVAGVAHVILGSNVLVPAMAIATMAIAALPLARYGLMNISAVILLLIGARYVGFPVFAKLLEGQALDSNLDQPVAAFAVVLLGVAAYWVAVSVTNSISVGRPVLQPITESWRLRRLSIAAYLIGFVANLDMSLTSYTDSEAVTLSFFFAQILHISLIAAAAEVLIKTDGRRILDWWTALVLATEIGFAFATNVRTPIIEAVLCLVFTAAAFRGAFTRRQVVGGVVSLLLLLIITPPLMYVRNTRTDLSVGERISATFDAMMNMEVSRASLLDSMDQQAISSGFFMRYYEVPNSVFERFSHVNDVDVLISGAEGAGTLGVDVLEQAFARSLPRFVMPDKPLGYGEGDWLYCEFNIKCLYGNYLTASMIGVGYAAYGWLGVVAFPLFLSVPILFVIKKMTGFSMTRNVWVVYIMVSLNNALVEGGASTYFAILLRQLPQDFIVMLLLSNLSGATLVWHRRRAR